MIIFENDGLIDPLAITTFGLNAKLTDNPIGFFGTGLKYAIAVLLRTGHDITIHRGTEAIRFDVQAHESRGKEFKLVTMNGQPMGFTTELGKKWELWQAFRELWCNCADEGGRTFSAHFHNPVVGKTTIEVRGDDFATIYARRSEFILDTPPLFKLDGVDVHKAIGRAIFYRGIAVGMLPENQKPLYTYNIIESLELTEDRTVKYSWQPPNLVAKAIQSTEHREFIEAAVRAPRGSFERTIDHAWMTGTPSKAFVETVEQVRQTHSHDMSESAKTKAETHQPLPPIRAFKLTDAERDRYETACLFLNGLGYEIGRYTVNFVESLGPNILGSAYGGEITITREAFARGTKQLTITLLEEFFHLRFNIDDETRAMQERLLHELVRLGEKFVLGRAL